MKQTMLQVLIVAVLLVVAGCGDRESPTPPPEAEDVQEEMTEAMDVTADDAYDQKDTFVATINTELDKLDSQIADLKEKAQAQGDDLKEETNITIDNLQKEAENLKQKAAEAGDKGEDAWKAAQTEIAESLKNLREAYDEAAEELK